MSSLAHHGVKGQKWGVRRYQNPDGTRTALGKKQLKAIRLSRNEEGIRQVYRSLSDRDLNLLGYEKEEIEANRKDDFKDLGRRHTDYDQYNRVRYKNGDAVGYIAATGYQTAVGRGKKIVNILAIDLAVNSNYRGQGHSVELGKDIVRWFDRYGSKEYDRMEWYAKAENIASQKAAERSGFERRSKKEAAQGWVKYSYKGKKVKHSSIGGNMNYIYGNTLVLGDSSYLAHHGILGQKWGIRRFQNKDGSRTAEGKKRYKTMQAAHGTRARGNSPFDRAKNRAIDKAKDEFNELLDSARYGKNKAKYDAAVDEWDKAQTHRYDEYEKEFDKYASIAGMANAYRCGWDQPNAGFGSRDNMLEFATEFYKYDDGDQGKFNSYDYFLVGKGENPNDVQDKAFEASSAMWDLAKEDAKDLFGDLADKKDGPGSTVATSFASSMFNYATAASPITMVDESSGLRYTDQEIKQMQEDIRKFSVEAKRLGTISHSGAFVENGTLYLCHHGIKNQKWGIRRFQNPDGSLTAAGRIRYGVTGAAKAAFKVGKKLGSATASAARAGVKKAKENAYAKKKEKASQTREGVLKNKKMFTADELKALETRFKIEDEMSEASLRHGQAVAKTVSQYANTTRDVLSALQTGGNAVSAITKAFADIQSYQNAKGVAEAAKEKGMTTKEFDLFLKEKYPNAKKDDGSKKKDKNSNKAKESDSDDNDDDNPPNNGGGGGGGSKKQAEYAANRQKAQEAIYAKRKADLDARESGAKQREDYLNKRQEALVKVSKQRQSEQDAREVDLNRRDKAASEREEKLKSTAKTAADVMSKLNKRKADLDEKEAFLNSEESYRLDTLSEFKKNEEEAARRKKKKVKHSAIGEEMYVDYLEHFGTKGMKWGVRRYQNPDGTLTDAGRKHYQRKLDVEERKLTAANAARGQYERVRPAATAGSAIVGAIVGASLGAASMLTPAGIAAGAAYMAAVSGASMYTRMTIKGAVAGAGAKRSKKKIAKYKEALSQDGFQIQNGVLMYGFAPSDELEHFGIKNMKWGVRKFQNKDGSLTEAGKQRYANTGNLNSGGGGGGGAPEEEDEETKKAIEEAAKKAGMTVDEYRKKFADKVAALKEKAQEAKDKFKSKSPKRSIALEVANTGPVPVGQTEIHTADVLNKYYGAMARARKTAANSTAAQRAKYGDRQNIRERAEAEELNNLRAREKRDEAIRLRMAKKFDKKADSARAHGNIAKAEAFEKESNRQFNKAPVAGSKAEAFEAVRDSKLASHLVRNASTAKRAQSATLAENRNRNAAHLSERRREKAINEAKAKIRSGKLPTSELTRYAKSTVGQLKSEAKAELARRERKQALTSMGSDYARATARVTATSSTTNTTDAHNEKLARDRRDKRKQAARASATAKKNRLAGSGRKKYTSGQTSSIGRVGSGRGKTSTRR